CCRRLCLRLPAELERVDGWLDDEAFFDPFRAHFDARLGRPSVPIETYLRLMFLKFRCRLGYETLPGRQRSRGHRPRTPSLSKMYSPMTMNTAGTIQWPKRSIVKVTRRWDTSHDPTRHHTGTPAANTATVNTMAPASRVANTGV